MNRRLVFLLILLSLMAAISGCTDMDTEQELGVSYTTYENVLAQSDILTFHVPLTDKTFHMVGNGSISRMLHGVIIINTSIILLLIL